MRMSNWVESEVKFYQDLEDVPFETKGCETRVLESWDH